MYIAQITEALLQKFAFKQRQLPPEHVMFFLLNLNKDENEDLGNFLALE